jgi:hypothetical protein
LLPYVGVAPIWKSVSILAINGLAWALKNISWKLYLLVSFFENQFLF